MDGPWHIDITPWQSWVYEAGSTPNRYAVSGNFGGGVLYPNGFGSASNEIGWDVPLTAGTWTITLIYNQPGAINAIATMKLDTTTVGTIDMSTGGSNAVGTISGISVSTDAIYRLKFTTPTTNTANYYYELVHITLSRTA